MRTPPITTRRGTFTDQALKNETNLTAQARQQTPRPCVHELQRPPLLMNTGTPRSGQAIATLNSDRHHEPNMCKTSALGGKEQWPLSPSRGTVPKTSLGARTESTRTTVWYDRHDGLNTSLKQKGQLQINKSRSIQLLTDKLVHLRQHLLSISS